MSFFQPRATQRPATPAGHVGLGIGENGSRPFLTAPVFGFCYKFSLDSESTAQWLTSR